MVNDDRLLTVQEVADLMRVSTMTVYRLIKSGQLSAIRVGRSWRLRPSEIDRFLADCGTPSSPLSTPVDGPKGRVESSRAGV